MAYFEDKSLKGHSAFTTGYIYEVTGLSKSTEVWVRYKYQVG